MLAREPLDDAAQRGQQGAWEAAIVASGLPVAGLDLPRPRPRIAFAAPLGAGVPGEAELLDVFLVERQPAWRVREALRASMPVGYRLVDAYDVWLGEAALPGRVVASVYRVTCAADAVDAGAIRLAAEGLLAAPEVPRERRKGEGVVRYDLRPFLVGLEVTGEPEVVLRMTLRHDPERGVGRPDEVLAELGVRMGAPVVASSLVRERLVLDEPGPGRGKARQASTATASRPRK